MCIRDSCDDALDEWLVLHDRLVDGEGGPDVLHDSTRRDRSVSYTHLDVYKRQTVGSKSFISSCLDKGVVFHLFRKMLTKVAL